MNAKRISMVVSVIMWGIMIPILAGAAPIGKVTHVEGQADITAQGMLKACHVGEKVSPEDIIRTKKLSRVGVTLSDGNVLWIAPLTRMRITQYNPGEGKQNYCDFFRGKTRAVINALGKGSSFEIHTPTAVAGVRGTIFFGYFERGQSGFVFERGRGYGYNRQMRQQRL